MLKWRCRLRCTDLMYSKKKTSRCFCHKLCSAYYRISRSTSIVIAPNDRTGIRRSLVCRIIYILCIRIYTKSFWFYRGYQMSQHRYDRNIVRSLIVRSSCPNWRTWFRCESAIEDIRCDCTFLTTSDRLGLEMNDYNMHRWIIHIWCLNQDVKCINILHLFIVWN
jgi:hypothetical protein